MWTEVVVAYLEMIPEDFLIGRNRVLVSEIGSEVCRCSVKTWNFIEARRISLDLV